MCKVVQPLFRKKNNKYTSSWFITTKNCCCCCCCCCCLKRDFKRAKNRHPTGHRWPESKWLHRCIDPGADWRECFVDRNWPQRGWLQIEFWSDTGWNTSGAGHVFHFWKGSTLSLLSFATLGSKYLIIFDQILCSVKNSGCLTRNSECSVIVWTCRTGVLLFDKDSWGCDLICPAKSWVVLRSC